MPRRRGGDYRTRYLEFNSSDIAMLAMTLCAPGSISRR